MVVSGTANKSLGLIESSTLRFPSNIASLSTSSSCNFSISLKFDIYLVARMHKAVITSCCRQQNIYCSELTSFVQHSLSFVPQLLHEYPPKMDENVESSKQTPLSFQFGCSFPSFGLRHKEKHARR